VQYRPPWQSRASDSLPDRRRTAASAPTQDIACKTLPYVFARKGLLPRLGRLDLGRQLGRLDRQRIALRLRLGELDLHDTHAVGERIGASTLGIPALLPRVGSGFRPGLTGSAPPMPGRWPAPTADCTKSLRDRKEVTSRSPV
jgi:hypothetical protein